ncbi:MAG: DNA polymerase domain-containing protein, partial [Candidatus Nanoarchaeia archaeon]|nr:DNA polymerase domain-containing protein [Candidatus Nanoarchaeia archaeon]
QVVYSDTDSVAFKLNAHTKPQTLELLKEINKNLPGIMELDLEDFYKRGIWVTKRTGEFGAKKKYALINEENKIKIRGFETVRRDWCNLARETQNKVLHLILNDGNEQKALEYVKNVIRKIKNREIEIKEVLIRTQLKKSIDEYKAITPHVIAARKIKEAGKPIDIGMLVEYFIAEVRSEKEKKLVREKVKLPDEKGEYNINYYLNNQILPAVENIFEVFNINIKEIADGSKQKKLGEF